ncbi:Serine/threonine-protein kinase PknD [subsurface metagenome]|nr:protein kinase [bacterium]
MGDYRKIRELGCGQFGKVWLEHDQALNVERAVKYVEPSRIIDPTDFYREPRLLEELRHENIVRVVEANRENDGKLRIAMEYLPRGSVEDRWGERPVPIMRARGIICDICWALEYAHSQKDVVIHRDIKPGNILISDNWTAKLSDFGLAMNIPEGGDVPFAGYLAHIAPEAYRTRKMNPLTDIYALGVTAYRMLNGKKYLPEVITREALIDQIIKGKYPDRKRYRPCVPDVMRKIVNKAMKVEPKERYQSASSFRNDLATKVRLHCQWKWTTNKRLNTVTYTTWVGSIGRRKTIKVVVRCRKENEFDIITTKKFYSGYERKVSKAPASASSLSTRSSVVTPSASAAKEVTNLCLNTGCAQILKNRLSSLFYIPHLVIASGRGPRGDPIYL